jgi:hypothetical protein
MSMPSLSWATQMGVIAFRASLTSRHDLPAMGTGWNPESSNDKDGVPRLDKKAYGSSAVVMASDKKEQGIHSGRDLGLQEQDWQGCKARPESAEGHAE